MRRRIVIGPTSIQDVYYLSLSLLVFLAHPSNEITQARIDLRPPCPLTDPLPPVGDERFAKVLQFTLLGEADAYKRHLANLDRRRVSWRAVRRSIASDGRPPGPNLRTVSNWACRPRRRAGGPARHICHSASRRLRACGSCRCCRA